MKITSILNERAGETTSALQIYKSLTPLQIGVVKRIASGRLDPFANDLSDRTHAVLDSLVDMSVLDQSYDLSPIGQRILQVSTKIASQDVRNARANQFRKELSALKRVTNKRPTSEVPVEGDEEDDDLDNDGDGEEELISKPVKKKKPSVKELEREDFNSFDNKDTTSMDDDGEYQWD